MHHSWKPNEEEIRKLPGRKMSRTFNTFGKKNIKREMQAFLNEADMDSILLTAYYYQLGYFIKNSPSYQLWLPFKLIAVWKIDAAR